MIVKTPDHRSSRPDRRIAWLSLTVGVVLVAAFKLAGYTPVATSRHLFTDTMVSPFDCAMNHPRGIAVGPAGRVFVVDRSGMIYRFAPDGKCQYQWALPNQQNGTPTGIHIDSEGRLLVADTHNSRVLVYDEDGQELVRFGTPGTGPGEFLLPTDVTVGPKGDIYVAEYGGNDRISRFDSDYNYISSFGGPDDSQGAPLSAPYGLCTDHEGTIWVADSGNHRVVHFDASGSLLTTIGGLGRERGRMRYPYDVAWIDRRDHGSNGDLLVCEKANNRLQRIDLHGHFIAMLGGPGRRSGQLSDPTSLAIDRDGRILVADQGNNRITILAIDGYNEGS